MQAHVLPNIIVFDGILDETDSINDFVIACEELVKTGATPPFSLDFSKVKYANSAGIVTWLKFANQSKFMFKYVNVPVWLVNHFNSISAFFENGSSVESFDVPFFAPKSQDSRAFTLKVGQDIPVLKDYSEFKIPNRMVDGKHYEVDCSPERYFHFISENFAPSKAKLK